MKNKEWVKSFSIIRYIDDTKKNNSIDREQYLTKLASGCIENVHWDIAEKAIEQIIHDEKQKVQLTYSLVESCLQSGERQMAFNIVTRFTLPESPEYQILNSLTFFRVVCAYVKANDSDVNLCALRYIRAAIEKEFSLNGVTHKYKKGIIQAQRVSKLADDILRTNFEYLMECFKSDDWTESMDRIEQLVRSKASFQEFEKYFNLEGTPEPEPEPRSHNEKMDRENILALYMILDLPPTATRDEIKKQYRKLSLQWHPDKLQKGETETDASFETRKREAFVKFTAISTAYHFLVD
jgi:hypothetical protein